MDDPKTITRERLAQLVLEFGWAAEKLDEARRLTRNRKSQDAIWDAEKEESSQRATLLRICFAILDKPGSLSANFGTTHDIGGES